MPSVNLLPSGDIANSPAWDLSTGGHVYDLINDDDSGVPTSDARNIYCTATGKICIVDLDDLHPSLSGITINRIKFVIKVNVYERAKTYDLRIHLLDGSGSPLYTETLGSTPSSASWNTHNGTWRVTSNGSDAWNTVHDLDDLRLEIESYALTAGGTLRVTYAYILVDYSPAVITDDAIFLGTNF